MFQPGDKVVHARHGAGVVLETRIIVFEGKQREYLCIQMDDARHTLLIPVESIGKEELRLALTNTELIEEVLSNEPHELSDNYRTRQYLIREDLKSRDPRLLAQVLRDLAWLEYHHKLTNTDIQLRDKVLNTIARELALKPTLSVRGAYEMLVELVRQATQKHIANHPEAVPAN